MSARQELHWVGEDRNVPAVTTQPDRVWAIPCARSTPPTLPFVPRHGHNAFSNDMGHDWSMRGPGGCLRYSPGGWHSGAWLLCEWDEPAPKPKSGRARNLSFAPATWEAMQARAAERGFASVSAYLTHLVNEDTKAARLAPGRSVVKVKR